MAKVSLAAHMKEEKPETGPDPEQQAGPFVTISRQYGCYGFSLGLLLMELLNDDIEAENVWKIYHREILERLASETNFATDLLERQRRTKPRLIGDFLRALSKERVPSGYEVRKQISAIVRGLAIDGYAIVIGQGGAQATQGLPGWFSIRLEAPKAWRVKEVAFREGLSETKAKMRIQAMEREREYLKKVYETRSQDDPAFDLIFDCSRFTLAQIAQTVVYAMKLSGLIG